MTYSDKLLEPQQSNWSAFRARFRTHSVGSAALMVVLLFCLVAIYAPFLASSKPLYVVYQGKSYFPLFRYLFYSGFYTKRIDLFFNLLMFTGPLFLFFFFTLKNKIRVLFLAALVLLQLTAFGYISWSMPVDPAADTQLTLERQEALKQQRASGQAVYPNWEFELRYLSPYAQLNLILRYKLAHREHLKLQQYLSQYVSALYSGYRAGLEQEEIPAAAGGQTLLPTLWQTEREHLTNQKKRLELLMESYLKKGSVHTAEYGAANAELRYLVERNQWLEQESEKLHPLLMPLLSNFHWEDDASGHQALNQALPWWELTRVNRKNLLSALIFGTRISLVVGIVAVGLALAIGLPIGALAGYYGGIFDIAICRLIEIWETMPTFFMLLMVVAILQSKSVFLVIAVIGLFSWTTFSRYLRGEFLKQRNLPYVEACHALGFPDHYIMFRHLLPNSIPPILTLLPFAIMGAITSEAGLSFLGLGEEGSCSWGVLMDEARTAFPQEGYLMWPPAILLTLLLTAIAVVGDTLRDTLDPRTS